jgi:23S rRNA (guanosine2251-2'-O)-methyltransferase
MNSPEYHIRKCQNPDCGLRYPVEPDFPRAERCPRCRGSTQLVLRQPRLSGFELPAEGLDEAPSSDTGGDWEQRVGLAGRQSERPILAALLDNIRSAWNVGSMFRTADGLGLELLALAGITPTPEHPRLARTALGAERALPWRYFPDALQAANLFQQHGWQIWALEASADESAAQAWRIPAGTAVLLVVGNELYGVDPDLLALSQRVVSIPMHGRKRSFNAAVAFGIAAHALLRGSA